jgi:hypothetical protein
MKALITHSLDIMINTSIRKSYSILKTAELHLQVSKAIPVTDCGGLLDCQMLKIPHCLDNRLTVNCKILATCSSTYSPVRTSQEAHSVSIK